MPSKTPTAYALECKTHGKIYLTRDEYLRQLESDDDWLCPIGLCEAVFHEENYKEKMGVERRNKE